MKRLKVIFFFLIITSTLMGQIKQKSLQHNVRTEHEDRYAIPGSHLLLEAEYKIRDYLIRNPESLKDRHLKKSNAWQFQVGDHKSWWATNLTIQTNDSEYRVQSTCRAVGQHCYIFVEDALWEDGGNGRVTRAAVESLVQNFDSKTPADAEKGIFDTVVDTFGDPPDVDNDPRIIILILDIIDGYDGSGGYVGGYFFSANEFVDLSPALQGHRSNHAEIYYVDGDPQNLTSDRGLSDAMNTTAHEFQHMIHWHHDWDELTFINEGCSEISSVVCGYPLRNQSSYVDETNVYLLEWRKDDNIKIFGDYARAARWILYLHEQFPNGYLKKLVADQHKGYEGINNALAHYSPITARRFLDVFEDWLIANYIDDATVKPEYAYEYPLIKVKPARTHIDPNVSPITETVQNLGAQYIQFIGGTNLTVHFTTSSPSLVIKAIKIGSTVVVDVPPNTPYDVTDFGRVYDEVTFVLINRNTTIDAVVTYSATGDAQNTVLELIYDDGHPEGYLNLTQGDTIAVYFDGVQGTTLDSLRIAFLQTGQMKMGINRYTGVVRPTPVGQPLIQPFTITSSSAVAGYPYPVPYNNWETVDLSSQNIDAGSDFIVWFLVGPIPRLPGLMVSSEPDAGGYHSYTYLGENQNWYILSDGSGNVFNYMVHAYLVSTQTGIPEATTGAPVQYSLSQNFPNPFNPMTTIHYGLPRRERVTLTIYDTRGRQVARLLDEIQNAGHHQIVFDGSRLSSGIYIYRIRAGNFSETKKLTLIR